ncbi:hypothetical protein [Acinetobacter gerneri]|uniref:hypothetical protein n=1 Tax=Acinetobacter gerneri TaxID=202952 RepID=UPI003215EA2B
MTVGLQVFNINNEPIIDTNYINYGLKAKVGINTLPKGAPSNNIYPWLVSGWYYIDVAGVAPIIFGDGMLSIPTVEYLSSNKWRYFIELYSTNNIYIFDLMSSILPNGSPKGVGFESYKDDGSLIFTTALKPLKIIQTSKLAGSAAAPGYGDFQAYGMYWGSDPTKKGENGSSIGPGNGYSDQWIVSNVPQSPKTLAATMTRYRYGAAGSSTETSYGDALIEVTQVNNTSSTKTVKAFPGGTSISGEDFGGFYGQVLDSVDGFEPYILIADVSGY